LKRTLRTLAALAGGYVLLALVIFSAAGLVQPELGAGAGEGVLRTFADDGVHERRLAVVDDDGTLWVASVQHFRRWYDRLVQNPEVELVRNDEVRRYHAVPVDSETSQRISLLLEERAGAFRFSIMRAVWLFAEIRAVRLDPL